MLEACGERACWSSLKPALHTGTCKDEEQENQMRVHIKNLNQMCTRTTNFSEQELQCTTTRMPRNNYDPQHQGTRGHERTRGTPGAVMLTPYITLCITLRGRRAAVCSNGTAASGRQGAVHATRTTNERTVVVVVVVVVSGNTMNITNTGQQGR